MWAQIVTPRISLTYHRHVHATKSDFSIHAYSSFKERNCPTAQRKWSTFRYHVFYDGRLLSVNRKKLSHFFEWLHPIFRVRQTWRIKFEVKNDSIFGFVPFLLLGLLLWCAVKKQIHFSVLAHGKVPRRTFNERQLKDDDDPFRSATKGFLQVLTGLSMSGWE